MAIQCPGRILCTANQSAFPIAFFSLHINSELNKSDEPQPNELKPDKEEEKPGMVTKLFSMLSTGKRVDHGKGISSLRLYRFIREVKQKFLDTVRRCAKA